MKRQRALVLVGAIVVILSTGMLRFRSRGVAPPTTKAPAVASFTQVRAAYQPSDAQLLDRHGVVIHELRVDATRRRLQWSSLEDISPALIAAVIASEDRRFYRHGGVDALALLGATWAKIASGSVRGASTISMQLAALLDRQLQRHDAPRTLGQKWHQVQMAWALERRWSKSEILEAYLNLVTFRGELQGVAAAASVLFNKAPHGITAAEAQVLAVLLKAPNASQAAVTQRANALRHRLPAAPGDAAGADDLAAAVVRALSAPSGTGPRATMAPHVAHFLLQAAAAAAPVSSTLDATIQQITTDALRRNLLAVRDRRVQDGSVLVVDNASGDVLAYVGSSGVLSSARHVDGVRARRQAGSALKPFLYGLALEQRVLTPASLIEDRALEIPVAGGLYRPQNYDQQFRGLITVRTALAASLNVPAVRTLQLVGPETFVQRLRALGFAGLSEPGDYYGPALALGSAEVSLWELTNAFRTLANGGVWSALRMTAEPRAAEPARLYSEAAAFLISSILADRDSRSVTFGLDNPLATRFWSAVKTGTSKEMRDNWCVGYSRRFTVGVWVGNFSGQPMADVSGITGAAPVWLEIMNWLHRETPSLPPGPPAGVHAATVAVPHAIEPARVEWFIAGTEPPAAPPALSNSRPRIIAPVSGTILALDPDIPAAQQRIAFEAQPGAARVDWVLDGDALGSAAEVSLWPPRPGRHTLMLVDEQGQSRDTVAFVVRGDGSR